MAHRAGKLSGLGVKADLISTSFVLRSVKWAVKIPSGASLIGTASSFVPSFPGWLQWLRSSVDLLEPTDVTMQRSEIKYINE